MNSILDLLRQNLTGRYRPIGDEFIADCVLGFSFDVGVNDRGHVYVGSDNRAIGRFINDRYPDLPKFLQLDVAEACEQLVLHGHGLATKVDCHIVKRVGQPGQRINTFEVAHQLFDEMQVRGYYHPVLVAHPYHVARAAAVVKRMGLCPIVPAGLDHIPFNFRAKRIWTAHPLAWMPYEVGAIAYFKLKGYI